jgi:BMFP domain-containing protein YqiC
MNVNDGRISPLDELTKLERESGEWVPVSDEVAIAARATNLEAMAARIKALEAEQS